MTALRAFVAASAILSLLTHANAGAKTAKPPHPSAGFLGVCGGYRWSIKIAADPGASEILPSPTPARLADLVSIRRPAGIAIRNAAAETTIWQVENVHLTFMYQEHDKDYHLVLEDGSGHHLIAEAPYPSCARTSPLLADIERVRHAINARFGGVHGGMRPDTMVSVRGVGFFDEPNGSAGQARNAIELHPLTAICFGANCALP